MCAVLIVHTSETQDWATYLRLILEASHHLSQDSITFYHVDEGKSLQDDDYSIFHSSKCIMLLVSMAFLDLHSNPEAQNTLKNALQPPCKVVAFMCGVSESDGLMDYFQQWDLWRKLDSEDEPSKYVSTVLEVIAEENVKECVQDHDQHHDQHQDQYQWRTDYEIPPPKQSTDLTPPEYGLTAPEYGLTAPEYGLTAPEYGLTAPEYGLSASEYGLAASENNVTASEEPENIEQSHQFPPPDDDPYVSDGNPTQPVSPTAVSSEEQGFLTVQPHRILCGAQVDVYLIMVKKLDSQASVEVEFRCKHSTKCVPGVLVNDCIVRAQSPDMPAGDVSLHLYTNESILCSTTVTYFTEMEEISSYLEKVMDPIQFMCQAFQISSNASEALDDLFTNSLKNRMPANGLQVFGVSQLEQENALANQRNSELPTLLHFSAKYGLKKLTSMLLKCPGALQAYSVVNKNGDYPNTLAEKSGFSDLRQFMDNYVETVDLVKSHMEETTDNPADADIYEPMANTSQDFVTKYSIQEDIYESMMQLNPEMEEMELYEDLSCALNEADNPEEAMLRKFFEVKPEEYSENNQEDLVSNGYPGTRADEEDDHIDIYAVEEEEEEEDPYKICCPEEIYDTVDEHESSAVLNRPPAPIPRPAALSEPDECKTYIASVFSSKESLYSVSSHTENQPSNASVWPVRDNTLSSAHDPYAGMKTPGQRQLISLQERVKVGALTVEEAVQEFKAWQFDQEKRAQSIRFQQDNLQRLRDSITRRHKEKGRSGKVEDLEITAPMQRSLQWGSHINVECSVYEPTPRSVTLPPPVSRPPQRGTWQTGSASSTSSSGSNRLSTLSTISYSSGADGELEETPEFAPPPRPPRPIAEAPPTLPPPRVPPRTPERFPESMLHERYVSSPARVLNQVPPQRPIPPPPVPRRPR
ncbi:phosphoinositide 3-kinase adapter protein 1 [Pygocentrus nattereri]|nr:phosphoinositide 3-kinase adapter protein 1 [Pygocentrus nattereri]